MFHRSSSSPNVSPIWRNRLVPASSNTQTDRLGEFALRGIRPGEYYVLAYPGPMDARNTRPLPTYFPNTTDVASATPVRIEAGHTVEGVVIQMLGAPAFQVSGVVVDETGMPIVDALVKLTPDEPPAAVPFTGVPGGQAHTDATGRFLVPGLLSRRYTLLAIPGVIASTGDPRPTIGGTVGPGFQTRRQNGTTMLWQDAAGTRVPIVIEQSNVSDLKIVVRRPAQ